MTLLSPYQVGYLVHHAADLRRIHQFDCLIHFREPHAAQNFSVLFGSADHAPDECNFKLLCHGLIPLLQFVDTLAPPCGNFSRAFQHFEPGQCCFDNIVRVV